MEKDNTQDKNHLTKKRIIIGWSLILFSLGLFVSFGSYILNWQSDQSQMGNFLDKKVTSDNVLGKVGSWFGHFFIFDNIGIAAFIFAFLVFFFGSIVLKWKLLKPWKTISHCLFFICWTPIAIGAITGGSGTLSGIYGFEIQDWLKSMFGAFGLWIIILGSFALYFIFEFDLKSKDIKNQINTIHSKSKEKFSQLNSLIHEEDEEINENENKNEEEKEKPRDNNLKKEPEEIKISSVTPTESIEEEDTEISFSLHNLDVKEKKTSEEEKNNFPNVSVKEEHLSNDSQKSSTKNNLDEIEINIQNPNHPENEIKTVLNENQENENDIVKKHGLYDHRLELSKFQKPSLDLLKNYGENENITISEEELKKNQEKIKELLKNFNVEISRINAIVGPTVTLYEIVPAVGIRVSAIKKLQDDIALNLSALGIRIIAPIPGKGTIGIEVPRKHTAIVSMRSAIASSKFQNAQMDLPIVFGKTISNDFFVADLAKMPHLLMAGATGQGKSVGINAILASLLYKKHPSELKFVMVDPKKVELSLYSKIERHYLAKLPDTEEAILTDNSKVINTLNSLCIEMDNRYELLKNAFCKNIKEYNLKFTERRLNPEHGHRYLPYIVLVVDEFADLIMTAGKEVEIPIARLAQLARAVGIHLIIATQRPSVNVITGMIKANFPARVAFRVISGVDSKTILDSPGAEQLIGKGDMLYFNGNELIRLQCPFIDTPEVEKIAEFIGEQNGYPEAYALPEYEGEESRNSTEFNPNERDVLFEEAARIVVSNQQGSTSMLQRQLKLGYNRAGRIMDQLEACGVVGSFNGAKAREVLIKDVLSLEHFLDNLNK